MKVELETARGCAWRARYLRVNGRQVAHLGVDPNDGTRPQLFGRIFARSFRFALPTVHWKHPMSPLRSRLYGAVHLFWHMVDGRYGWGSKYRRKQGTQEQCQKPNYS